MSANRQSFQVVIDTRENAPYHFSSKIKTVRRSLPAGDYSIEGCERRIAIERKSKADAYGSLGQHRARFEREIARMVDYEYAAIIIECSLVDFLVPPEKSRLKSKAAINTLISWSVKYGVKVWFAGSREMASVLTLRLLEKFAKHRMADG